MSKRTQPNRAITPLLWLAMLLLLFVAACSANDVMVVPHWTVERDGASTQPIDLPGHLSLPDRPTHVVLRTEVRLPRAMRGRPLTLAFVRLPALATLYANEHAATPLIEDLTSRYRVSGAQSWNVPVEFIGAGDVVRLRLELEHRYTQSAWIDCAPRLSASGHGDALFLAIRGFNEISAIIALVVVFIAGFSYLFVWVFDRRRTTHGWFGLEAVGAIGIPLFATGLTQPVFGTADATAMGLFLAFGAISTVCFVHSYFRLAVPARPLFASWLALCAYGIATRGPFTATRWFTPAVVLFAAASMLWQVALCARLLRRLQRPWDLVAATNIVLVTMAWPLAALFFIVETAWWLGYGSFVYGLQGGCAAITVVAFLRIAALGREHERSLRTADRLNRELADRISLLETQGREVNRLNDELRRQVAERSAQLADSLARVGARHSGAVVLEADRTVAGRYRVTREIAAGGMGSVYEVVRMTDGTAFALKVLHGRNDPRALARFAREAQIAAQIQHPNVVSIVDIDVDAEGFLFLVMELVRGTPLSECKHRAGDVDFCLVVLHRVADGLAAIHAQSIVHRDLKPANVLILDPDGDPRPKITDFGIAALWDGELSVALPLVRRPADDAPTTPHGARLGATPGTPRESGERMRAHGSSPSPREGGNTPLTETGIVMGTPAFMAPELLEGARNARPSSDLFSFGVMAYLLFASRLPFGKTHAERAAMHATTSLGDVAPHLPSELVALVDACLSLDPMARPSAREVADALASLCASRARRPAARAL